MKKNYENEKVEMAFNPDSATIKELKTAYKTLQTIFDLIERGDDASTFRLDVESHREYWLKTQPKHS